MKKALFFTLIFFIAPILVFGQSNSWNGITPLYSTRADVENIPLIKIKEICESAKHFYICRYIFQERQIVVAYAWDRCKGEINGFDVPKDTVLKITAYSINGEWEKSFDGLNLNKDKFSLSIDDGMTGYWTNPEEGRVYLFTNIEQQLISIGYIPKKSDNNLRCNGFPSYTPEGHHYTQFVNTFDEEKINKRDYLGWLINSFEGAAIYRSEDYRKEYNGYLLIYFNNKLPYSEYKKLLEEAKKRFVEKNGDSLKLISIIEGGMKEKSQIELYIIPKEWKPPAPNPTLPSPQFIKSKS